MRMTSSKAASQTPFNLRPVVRWTLLGAIMLALGACGSTPGSRKIGSHKPAVQGGYKIGVPYQIKGVWYYPKEDFSYDKTGLASWYGRPFHGRTSASGERYNMWAKTAAHKTLPMPSLVEVTNLDNGRRMVLRINDRGPFVSGRIIDLSRGAARQLGVEKTGVARVRVRILAKESRRMKQLAIARQNKRAIAVAARRQRRNAGGNQLARMRRIKPLPAEIRPVRAQPVAVARPAPVVRSAPARRVTAARPATSRRGQITVTELPPSGSSGSGGVVQRRAPAAAPAAAGPGRVAGARTVRSRPKASIVRTARAAPGRSGGSDLQGRIYVQAGAFRDRGNAHRMRQRLSSLGAVRVVPVRVSGRRYFRVRVGPVPSATQGNRLLARVVDAGYPRAQIVID